MIDGLSAYNPPEGFISETNLDKHYWEKAFGFFSNDVNLSLDNYLKFETEYFKDLPSMMKPLMEMSCPTEKRFEMLKKYMFD